MRFQPANPTAGRQPLPPVGDEVTSLHSRGVPASRFPLPTSVKAPLRRLLRGVSCGPREKAIPQSAFRTPPSPGTLGRGLGWLAGLLTSAGLAWAQGTAFSYQGQLTDGAAAANGTYDLTFSLWNAATAGDQQGTTLTQTAVGVTNGLFTATLNFGAQFNGQGRWLEIAVRTNGAATFTTLAERQPVLPTPYAVHAATAGSAATATTATTVTGSIPATQLTGTLSAAQIPNLDASKINSGTFTGNGSGLTSLNASALTTGTVPGARIPDLDAGKITTGTLAAARLPNLDAGKVTTGTFTAAQIPNLDAAKITSGVLSPDRIPTLDASKIAGGTFTGNGAGLNGIPLNALVQRNYSVAAWGGNMNGQSAVPGGLTDLVALATGGTHSLVLKADGTVVAWGNNGSGQTTVPAGLSGVIALAAGGFHSLALKADGTVVAWGGNLSGQTTVPAGLSGVVTIAAGFSHSLALKADGTVVAWGDNGSGQTTVPAGLSGVIALAAGSAHSLALKADGTVVAWGSNGNDRTTVPAGLGGVVAIAAGDSHSLALKADGTVVAWGNNGNGRTTVPAGLSGVIGLAAGGAHSLALKVDGTVVAWGDNGSGQTTVPAGLSGVGTIAAGLFNSVALKADGVSPATLARLDRINVFRSAVFAPEFSGDGAGLTSLNASALSSGTVPGARIPDLDAGKITTGTLAAARIPSLDASKVTTGTFATAQIPNLDAAKITTGTFTGNGSGLISLNASALTVGTVPVAQIPNLDAGKITTGTFTAAQIPNLDGAKITTGTLADARLSANVARLNGSPEFTSDVRLDDHDLYLRGGTDSNHGLGWFGGSGRTFAGATVDGPVLYGFLGGALGSTSSSQMLALRWNSSQQVAIGGGTPDSVLTVAGAGAGISAETVARFRNTSASQHTAIAVDAAPGRDAVIYLGNNGTRAWDIRYDEGSGELQFRTQTDNDVRMWLTRNGDLNIDGTYRPISDRNKKAGFTPVDVDSVLAKVAALPLTTWHYTNDVAATPHLGPMAQDFHAAFGLGGDDKTIATVDADGVALAAIQGLHRKTEALTAENVELRGELTELRTLVLQLQQQLNANRP